MKRLVLSLSATLLAVVGSGCCCMDSCCKPSCSPCGNPCGNPCGAQVAPYGAGYAPPPSGAYVAPYGAPAVSVAPPVSNTAYYSPTAISALPPGPLSTY